MWASLEPEDNLVWICDHTRMVNKLIRPMNNNLLGHKKAYLCLSFAASIPRSNTALNHESLSSFAETA
jgi:hypothetical protein